MNKLQFHEGGQPLHLDDLAFLQDATTSPLAALISSWGDFIISGCMITHDKSTSKHHWEAGYIAYRGQVYRVSAGTFDQIDQANTFYWIFKRSDAASKTYEDGSEHHTQVVCTAELVSTRQAPESGDYIADINLPRLGIDFARSPRLSFSYFGVGNLVEFKELTRHSGILTLRFEKTDSLPTTGYFGVFRLSGVNNMSGRYTFVGADLPPTNIDVINGKVICRQTLGSGMSRSHVELSHTTYVSILISWDFDENNGDGSGINDGSSGGGSGSETPLPPRSHDKDGGGNYGTPKNPPRRR